MGSREYSGERLAQIVETQGRRWDWLADEAGVHRTLLWKIRTGRVGMTERTAARVAAALGVTLDALVRGAVPDTADETPDLIGVG